MQLDMMKKSEPADNLKHWPSKSVLLRAIADCIEGWQTKPKSNTNVGSLCREVAKIQTDNWDKCARCPWAVFFSYYECRNSTQVIHAFWGWTDPMIDLLTTLWLKVYKLLEWKTGD